MTSDFHPLAEVAALLACATVALWQTATVAFVAPTGKRTLATALTGGILLLWIGWVWLAGSSAADTSVPPGWLAIGLAVLAIFVVPYWGEIVGATPLSSLIAMPIIAALYEVVFGQTVTMPNPTFMMAGLGLIGVIATTVLATFFVMFRLPHWHRLAWLATGMGLGQMILSAWLGDGQGQVLGAAALPNALRPSVSEDVVAAQRMILHLYVLVRLIAHHDH